MEEIKHKHKKEKKTGSGTPALILLLILVLAVGGFTAWYFLAYTQQDDRMEPNAVVGAMPGKSVEQLEAELTQQVSEKEVAFAINSNPVFPTGREAGNILFENPQSNNKLTRVEVTLDDTGELIYKSGLLEPGSYVPEAKLLIDLDAGDYTCTATIYAYKLDDESFIGKVAAGLVITVRG